MIAVILAAVVLVVAVVVIAEYGDGHKARTGRLAAARVLSDGWRGDDPRSSEHPVFSPPVVLTSIQFGRGARSAVLLLAKPIHRQPAPVSNTGPSSSESVTATTDQSSAATSPQTTYTPPATATTTPTSSTGSGGGAGSTGSGASSNSSSTKTTPAYGPAGSLGPGSSPDS